MRLLYLLYLFVPGVVKYYVTGNGDWLFAAIRRSGCIFIKIAQWLAQRPDIVDDGMIQKLKTLQTHCQEYPFSVIKELIANELSLFKSIEETPLGIGSIAQVHKAVLLDGTTVVIKVRHPGVEDIARHDIRVIRWLLRLLPSRYRVIDFDGILENISQQTDLLIERDNLQYLRHVFRFDKYIKLPEVVYAREYLLVESFCPGIHINKAPQVVRARCLLYDAFIAMVKNRMIHGDLHDGNILCDGDDVYLLDFGMVIRLGVEDRKNVSRLIRGYEKFYDTGESDNLVRAARDLIAERKYEDKLKCIIESATVRHEGRTLFLTHKLFGFLSELFDYCRQNGIYFKDNVICCLLTLPIIEANVTNEYGVDFIRRHLRY